MNNRVKLQVCVTCLGKNKEKLGTDFYAALEGRVDKDKVDLQPVECFAVCTRPATVAVSQPEKWLYMIGDLKITDIDDLFAYMRAYDNSPNGRPPISERPEVIQKGTIARIPPQVAA